MKKFIAIFLVAMMVLAATASAEVITYIDHYNEDTKQSGVDALVAGTTAKNPEYTFEVSHMGYDAFAETIRTRLAADDAPDIFQGNVTDFPELVRAGMIVDWTDSEIIARLNEAAVAEASLDGKVWAVPMDKSVTCIFANLDCFEKNGIALPTTRSEFIDACDKLEAAGIQPFGIGMLTGAVTIDNFEYLAHPRIINEGITDMAAKISEGSAKFADYPQYAEALKDFNELFLKHATENELAVDRAEMLVGLANGSIAMVGTGLYSVGDIRSNNPDGNIGILPFPVYEDPEMNGIIMGIDDAFMIPSNADGIEGATAYLDYATTEEGVNAWIEKSLMLSTAENINVTTLDPMVKPMKDWIDAGKKLYYRSDLALWQGNDLSKMRTLMQAYAALTEEERSDYEGALTWLDEEFDAMR